MSETPPKAASTPSGGEAAPVIRVFDCHIAREATPGKHEYLLLKRSSHKIYAETWRMVGGKLEAGETAWQACLREVAEETQLPVSRLLCVPYVNRFYEWRHDRINDIPVFVAVTRAATDPILDDEHSEFEWLSLEAASARLHWPGQRQGLEAAAALLRNGHPLQGFMEVSIPG
jgi:dihydroneopterin triphosphate diphosphatase